MYCDIGEYFSVGITFRYVAARRRYVGVLFSSYSREEATASHSTAIMHTYSLIFAALLLFQGKTFYHRYRVMCGE